MLNDWLLASIIIGLTGLGFGLLTYKIPNIPERPHPTLGVATLVGICWMLLGIAYFIVKLWF